MKPTGKASCFFLAIFALLKVDHIINCYSDVFGSWKVVISIWNLLGICIWSFALSILSSFGSSFGHLDHLKCDQLLHTFFQCPCSLQLCFWFWNSTFVHLFLRSCKSGFHVTNYASFGWPEAFEKQINDTWSWSTIFDFCSRRVSMYPDS
jgi:hypothetical protein